MAISYLIDGYNLLHAMGVLHGKVKRGGLEKARLGLLDLLREAFGNQADGVTVVFDAAGAPAGAKDHQEYQGLHIRYALGRQQADDVIEQLIQKDGTPKKLAVVSDDRRLQKAAQRRQAQALGCGDFLDLLDRFRRPRRPAPVTPDKTEIMSDREKQEWIETFGDLDRMAGGNDYGWEEFHD